MAANIARYPQPATLNSLARQPHVARPLNVTGLNSNSQPQFKGAPSIRYTGARKPIVSR